MANPNIQIGEANDAEFTAADAADPRFAIAAWLFDGYLRFQVVAELANGGRGAVRGSEFFDAMMDHFGEHVKAIEGDWSDFDPTMTANLDTFNRLIAQGIDAQTAARATWTGKMAANHGYIEVEIVDTLPDRAAGSYTEVFVRFSRP